MAAQLLVPSNLPDLVKEKFNAAKEAQELTFWPTQVFILNLNGVPVRHSPCSRLYPTANSYAISSNYDTALASRKNPNQQRLRAERNRLILSFSHQKLSSLPTSVPPLHTFWF